MCHIPIDAIDQGSNLPYGKLIFSLLKCLITSEKLLYFTENEGNNKKVDNKVSSRVRVGVWRALLSQYGSIHLIIWIKNKMYTHSISYYCILFYNVLQY